jgi:c-di-GMP-binding flagellar brake protein YcgR
MSEPARVSERSALGQPALLEQICAGGAILKVSKRLTPGTAIGIQFKTSAGERSYDLSAIVVHATKEERGFNWRCGVCFINVDSRETQRLSAFVDAERKRREHGVAMARV